MITESVFGELEEGLIKKYRITNSLSHYVEILNYGGIIYSIYVPDRLGRLGNCVLSVPNAKSLKERSFSAVTIGRCANRIDGGHCFINGKEYYLEKGRNGHFMHGGGGNYGRKLFEVTYNSLGSMLTLHLEDTGEGGFDCNVDVKVFISFDDNDCLTLHYEMIPDGPTILCPTNHAYFNLGDFGDARKHILEMRASNLAKIGATGVPCGGIVPVASTPADFTSPREIGEAIASNPGYFPRKGFDHFYVLDDDFSGPAAILYNPSTGRVMETYTDMQSIILYTPSECKGRSDASGILENDFSAVCLETQFVPNAVNCPEFKSPVFYPGQKLDSITKYKFSVRNE